MFLMQDRQMKNFSSEEGMNCRQYETGEFVFSKEGKVWSSAFSRRGLGGLAGEPQSDLSKETREFVMFEVMFPLHYLM